MTGKVSEAQGGLNMQKSCVDQIVASKNNRREVPRERCKNSMQPLWSLRKHKIGKLSAMFSKFMAWKSNYWKELK